MNKEELQKIIDQLESGNSKEEASFGIFQYGGGPDESFIKANKQGLELFAAEMLKASRDAEEILKHEEKNIIPLDFEDEWVDGDTFIQYVEPTLQKESIRDERDNHPWKDKVVQLGCFAGILVAFVLVGVGLFTMIAWIF